MVHLRRWLFLLRVPIVAVGVVLFLSGYNRFIVNASLQNLKTSLSVLDAAAGVGQAEAALLLVDQTLVSAMAQEEIDLKVLTSLQYVQGVLATDQPERPVTDARVMVATLAQEQTATRRGLLSTLDAVATGVQGAFQRVALLPRQVGWRAVSQEIDVDRLDQAVRRERVGLFQEAAGDYEELLKVYPNYAGRTGLKLRLGYVYQRIQTFDRAQQLYRQVLKESRDLKEVDVAREMLEQLAQIKGKERQAQLLGERLSQLGAGPERQRVAFQIGSLLIQLYQMDKAAEAFHQAVLADPEGEGVSQGLFKEAWCLKSLGRFEEAVEAFRDLIRRDPGGSWAAAAHHQIAEVYKAGGNYEGAAQTYERIIAEAKDKALVAIVQAQTASTYLFDLHDPDKAAAHFRDLALHLPASPFSTIEQKIQKLHADEISPAATRSSLTPGSPILGWLEASLPTFVEVFAKRLVVYMESVGERELSRRYTEEEFREQVVRRVRELFPGQIGDIATRIRPDGFRGSGSVRVGLLTFQVEGRVGITVVEERPHAVIHELKVGPLEVPGPLRKVVETRVNQAIDRLQLPLKVTRYETKDGYAWITVELVD